MGLLTKSDSFILMVILLTASVALLNILRRPAPLKVCVPKARGSYKTKGGRGRLPVAPSLGSEELVFLLDTCPKLARHTI